MNKTTAFIKMQTIASTGIAITITAITITAITIIEVNNRKTINNLTDSIKISALNREIQTSMYYGKRKMNTEKEGVALSVDTIITLRRTVRLDGGRLLLQQTREIMTLISENLT